MGIVNAIIPLRRRSILANNWAFSSEIGLDGDDVIGGVDADFVKGVKRKGRKDGYKNQKTPDD